MDNLEKQIVDRLNIHFKKYNSYIEKIKPDTPGESWNNIFVYGFFTNNKGVYFWSTSNEMFFSKLVNIFNVCVYYKYPNFNKNIEFCKGGSLEEIILKMNLMGI